MSGGASFEVSMGCCSRQFPPPQQVSCEGGRFTYRPGMFQSHVQIVSPPHEELLLTKCPWRSKLEHLSGRTRDPAPGHERRKDGRRREFLSLTGRKFKEQDDRDEPHMSEGPLGETGCNSTGFLAYDSPVTSHVASETASILLPGYFRNVSVLAKHVEPTGS